MTNEIMWQHVLLKHFCDNERAALITTIKLTIFTSIVWKNVDFMFFCCIKYNITFLYKHIVMIFHYLLSMACNCICACRVIQMGNNFQQKLSSPSHQRGNFWPNKIFNCSPTLPNCHAEQLVRFFLCLSCHVVCCQCYYLCM